MRRSNNIKLTAGMAYIRGSRDRNKEAYRKHEFENVVKHIKNLIQGKSYIFNNRNDQLD